MARKDRRRSRVGRLPEAGDGAGRLRWAAALIAVFVPAAALAIRKVGSFDAGFHLRAGRHILSGQGWPRTDPFSFTMTTHEYIDTSWGYQVVIALVEGLAGAAGLGLFHAALVLAIFGVLWRSDRAGLRAPAVAACVLLLGVVSSEMRFQVRPELLSYLFLAVVLGVLRRHHEGESTPLWILPILHGVWANAHSLYVLGWVAMGGFVLGSALRDRGLDRRLAGWAALSVPVVLLNPYGWKAVYLPLLLTTRFGEDNAFHASIGEFGSPLALSLSDQLPFFPYLPVYGFRLFALLALLAAIHAVTRRRYASTLVFVAFAPLAFSMIRNMPLLVIACAPDVIRSGRALVERGLRPGSLAARVARVAPAVLVVAGLVLGLRVANDGYYIATRRFDRSGVGWNALALPVDAARYLDRVNPPGRMLNHLNFGGYLMGERDDPVFIDGRLEVVGEEFYSYYREALGSEEALERCVRRYGIGWIVFPPATNPRLTRMLDRSPRWNLAYLDHLAAVFVRIDAHPPVPPDESASVVTSRVPPVVTAGLPGFDGAPPESGAGRWLSGLVRPETFPSAAMGRGLYLHHAARWGAAAVEFARAVREGRGAYYEAYNNLGSALFRSGRLRDARRCYELVLAAHPGNRRAADRLREIDRALASPPVRPGAR